MKKIVSLIMSLMIILLCVPKLESSAVGDWYLSDNISSLTFEYFNGCYKGTLCPNSGEIKIGNSDATAPVKYSHGFLYQSNYTREWNGSATTYFTFTVPKGYKTFKGNIGICWHVDNSGSNKYNERHRVRIFVDNHQEYISPLMKIRTGYEFAIPVNEGQEVLVEVYGSGSTTYGHVCFGDCRLTEQSIPSADISFDVKAPKAGNTITPVIENCTLQNPQYSYKWTVDGETVSGTQDKYTVKESDIGKTVMCEVSDTVAGKIGSASVYLSSLPVMCINTDVGHDVTDKLTYLSGDAELYGNSEHPAASGDKWYDGGIQIRGRGNSSWTFRKKSYRIKLDSKAGLFGMPESKHWVLIANCYDETQMRNKSVYDYAGSIGMSYPRSEWVYVVLNGVDLGVYQICENIRIDKTRVNIRNWEGMAEDIAKAISKANPSVNRDDIEENLIEDLSWIDSGSIRYGGKIFKVSDYTKENISDVSGGYIIQMEYDNAKEQPNDYSRIMSKYGLIFNIKEPEYAVTSTKMENYLTDYINAFESAVMSENHTASYNGKTVHYSELADVDSIAKNFLCNEIFYNPDAGYNSNYMYKEVGGKLIFGPVWDFDCALACEGGAGEDRYDLWQVNIARANASGVIMQSVWYKYLLTDYAFVQKVYDTYHKYRKELDNTYETLKTNYSYLAADCRHNSDLWQYKDGFEKDYSDALNWLYNRIKWLDVQFSSVNNLYKSLNSSLGGLSIECYDLSGKSLSGSSLAYRQGLDITVSVTNPSLNIDTVSLFVNGKFIDSSYVIAGYSGPFATFTIEPEALPLKAGSNITVTATGLNLIKGSPTANMTTALIRKAAVDKNSCSHIHSRQVTVNAVAVYSCAKSGYSGDVICSDCGLVIKKGKTLTKSHTYGSYTVKKNATYFSSGLGTRKCSKCGYVQSTVIKQKVLSSPKSLSAERSSYSSVKLSWKKVSYAEGYKIYRKSGSGSYKPVKTVNGGKTLNYTDKKLKTGTKYTYKIKAFRKSGSKTVYSGYSSSKSVTPSLKKPTLKLSTKGKSVAISYGKISGADGYEIYCKVSKSGKYKKVYSGKKLSHTKKSLKSGKTYYFKVRAYRKVGSKKVYSAYSSAKKYTVK